MRRICVLLFIAFVLLQPFAYSQDSSKIKLTYFPKSYGEKKWKPLICLDARRSYFAGNKVKINGLRFGASYKGVHNFGFGFYWLNKKVSFNNITDLSPNQNIENPEVRFNLGYSSIFYERVFIRTSRWEIAFPVHLAGGRILGYYKDTIGTFIPYTERPFSALIPTVQAKFYPISWLAIRTLVGYRIVFNSNQEVKQTFRTAFLGYGLSINPIELYKTLFKKNKKLKPDSDNTKELR
jgi:hypothetical protein